MQRRLLLLAVLVSSAAFGQETDTLVYNAKRAVALEGGSNFRDLGGYPTQDGHHVKWGHIYRSADVSKLTDADLKTLEARHLAVDCDLRGPDEVKNGPDRMPAGVAYVNLPAGSENVSLNTNYATMNTDSMMNATYGRTDFLKAKYKPMFDQLLALDDTKALMFHCTAGKDRTGIGAALILSALGVDKAIVLKDYAATDVYWKQGRERIAQMMKGGTGQCPDGKVAGGRSRLSFFVFQGYRPKIWFDGQLPENGNGVNANKGSDTTVQIPSIKKRGLFRAGMTSYQP